MPSKPIQLVLLASTILLMSGGIFALDVLQPRPIAVLYAVVILIAAGSGRRQWVACTAIGATLLTICSYFLVEPDGVRCAIRIIAIGVVTSLILRNMAASALLREQARLLQQAQSELAHATRMTSLGQLTASIAHELNQPLASILANGQAGLRWLRRGKPDVDAVTTSLESVVRDARRSGEIITSVQMLVRNEAIVKTSQDLNEIVYQSVQLLNRELKQGSVKVVLELSHAVLIVLADRIQIQQVVLNLVNNAIQAMQGRTDTVLQIRISTAIEDGNGVVTICDTGPGIDPNVRDKLFVPFTTTKSEGMGLGLSICEAIMTRQGGRVYAKFDGLPGATFVFALPLHTPRFISDSAT